MEGSLQLLSSGVGLASRIDTFVDGKFSHMVDLRIAIRLAIVGMPGIVDC